jgi:hypothetical protein
MDSGRGWIESNQAIGARLNSGEVVIILIFDTEWS